MARSLRIEFEGARYHVLNRGNYAGFVQGADINQWRTEGAGSIFPLEKDSLLD